ILQENEEYIIKRDYLGRKTKLFKKKASISLPLDYPVQTHEDWEEIKHFFTFQPARIDWDAVKKAKQRQKKGTLVLAGIPGGFDFPRQLMGEEELCVAYYQKPDLIKDMMATISQTAFLVLEKISQELTIDNLRVHEDMAGKSGPLIGPKIFKEFIKPYYRKIWDMLADRGTQLFSLDSDGDVASIMDSFLASGVNIVYPMEPAAGMDIVKLRQKYGQQVAFKGGIDKHVLRKTKKDIDRELEYKMQPMMQKGGLVFALDHRIPNGTPLKNYRYYVKKGRKLLGLPPLDKGDKGWQRMAF
ncbi:MAG: uroporphyrinogen decarboxylase family protein, partial [bacterium]